jgi:molybdopterin synthase catalytic subunit
MSYLSLIARLFHYLIRLITALHIACRLAVRAEAYATKSNLSDALKTRITAWKTETESICTAVQTFKDNLPD